MSKGPREGKRPADAIGRAVHIGTVATNGLAPPFGMVEPSSRFSISGHAPQADHTRPRG